MQEPPAFLLPLLHTIESTVLAVQQEFPTLVDTDVEYAYEKLKNYYKKRAQGKNLEEPQSSIERKQALIDDILNAIDEREELKADHEYVNNNYHLPNGKLITSLFEMYVFSFNRLEKSARMWRKEFGKKGYLSFIHGHI